MNPLIECLGWTLIHFVWQGVVIALLLAVAFRLLRHAPANQRYLAGCVALTLMVLAPLVTSYWVAERAQPAPTVAVEPTPVVATPAVMTTQSGTQGTKATKVIVAEKPLPVREKLARQLNSVLPWLVTGWFVGVLTLSCRLLAGWLRIRRWQNGATDAIAEPWREKLKELAQHLSISRPVRLVQSALVEVPTVIGWLRPVILLPVSCVAGLSPEQLESILAHELAHIHRHDYIVNLLQSAVETLLFYHPAVWWVSRRIREERENCCDDIAVKICGDPVVYARALATLEELRSAPAQLALAAGGGSLLQRIQRLLGKSSSPASPAAWPLAGMMVAIALIAVAIGLRETRAMASEPPKPETFITRFGIYHFTNNGVAMELIIQTNSFVAATKGALPSLEGTNYAYAGGKGSWMPGSRWFVYIGKDLHLWAYDGANGLWIIAADSVPFKMRSLAFLDEIPPGAVLKRLPKDLRKTAFEIATPNNEKRQQFEELIHDAETHTNLQPHPHQMSKKRAAILSKLDHIRLESVEFDNLPLAEVVSWLNRQARLHDPDRKGIDFFIDRETPVSMAARAIADPTTGLPTTAERASDIDSVKVKIMPVLKDVRLGDVLDAITKTSDRPIKFSVYDYAIGFSLRGPETVLMETRAFHVDAEKLIKELEKAGFYVQAGETNENSRAEDTRRLVEALRKFSTSRGADLATNDSIFCGNRNGRLYVRTTPQKMAKFQSALDGLIAKYASATAAGAPSSAPVNIGAGTNAAFTVAAAGTPTLYYQWYTDTNVGRTLPSETASAPPGNTPANAIVTNNATFTVAATGTAPLSYQWVFNGTNIAGATHEKPQINIKVKFVEISAPEVGATSSRAADFRWFMGDDRARAVGNQTQPPKSVSPYTIKDNKSTAASGLTVTNSIVSQSTAIMNDPQSVRIVMKALEQRDGVDILTTPEITTRDNGQAQMQMLDLKTVVVGMSKAATGEKSSPHPLTETLGFGPIFDVLPKVSDDGLSIKMKMTASITGFKGYATAKPPTPQIDGRRLEAEATVPDGQTVLLYGRGPQTTVVMKDKVPVLGSIPLLGRLFQSKSTSIVRKDLLVFVTPTLINPDGTPYHSKNDSSGQSPSAPPSASRDEAKKTN